MKQRGTLFGLSASMMLAAAATAQPANFTDWGTHTSAETIDRLVTLTAANDVQWFKIVLPAVGAADGYVDIWNMPTATPTPALDISDSELGLYDNNGNLVSSDDDSGSGLWSQLSYGQTAPTRPTNPITGQANGLAFAGQGGSLAGGTYWLAVVHYNATFSAGWNVTTNYASTQRTTQLFVRVQPAGAPIPPTGTGTATPGSVAQGGQSLLTVNVTPGANPTSTGLIVEMNLGGIGGDSAQRLNDEGVDGDAAQGDGVYSFLATIPAATPPADYSLPFSIRDDQSRTGGGNIALRVFVPPQWDEAINGGGDAGNLPSACQTPAGADPFLTLMGNVEFSGDVDMYRIRICDPAAFSASTVDPLTVISDTQVFLFNAQGVGVTYNDDDTAGGGGLRSRITSQFIPAEPGTYYLAVTGFNADPADEGGNLLWINTPYGTERVPDGLGAANAVASWTGTTGTGVYRLNMTGVCFDGGAPPCDPDYNQDGNADQDDVAYLTNVIAGGGNPTGRDPDFNLDGNVDQDDYAALVNVIAGAPCP